MTTSIWLLILLFGAATYAMRVGFLLLARLRQRAHGTQPWLRLVPPAVLAALVLPALLVPGTPLTPGAISQVLAAALAALVAWRFQNVLWTVATGMSALWLFQAVLSLLAP